MLEWFNNIQLLAAEKMLSLCTSVSWSKPVKFGPFWMVLATIEWREKRGVGFAVDKTLSMAALKAGVEAIEILSLNKETLGIQSRSGCAGHFTLEQAKNSSFFELIERDAFLFHWLSEIQGQFMVCHKSKEFDFARSFCSKKNERFYLVKLLAAIGECDVVLAASKSKEYGCWMLGLGAGPTLDCAAKKAIREWTGNAYLHEFIGGCRPLDSETDCLSASEMQKLHHLGTKDSKVSELVEWIVSGPNVGSTLFNPLDSRLVDNKILDELMLQTKYTECPQGISRVKIIFAKNKSLLPLYFGNSYLNAREAYLENFRLKKLLPLMPKFHTQSTFLLHPLD